MKDIYEKPPHSPNTLDLSSKKPSKPKQTNFFEYMPAIAQRPTAAPALRPRDIHEDDEFGEKVSVWAESAWLATKATFLRSVVQVSAALKPLRLYWVMVIGAGLILGLLIISYIAANRNWITSSPGGGTQPASKTVQSDTPGPASNAPGKGGAAALPPATPAVSTPAVSTPAVVPGTSATKSSSSIPLVGGSAASTRRSTAPIPVSAPAPSAVPVSTPVPVLPATPVSASTPVPEPTTSAPGLIDGLLAPVQSVL